MFDIQAILDALLNASGNAKDKIVAGAKEIAPSIVDMVNKASPVTPPTDVPSAVQAVKDLGKATVLDPITAGGYSANKALPSIAPKPTPINHGASGSWDEPTVSPALPELDGLVKEKPVASPIQRKPVVTPVPTKTPEPKPTTPDIAKDNDFKPIISNLDNDKRKQLEESLKDKSLWQIIPDALAVLSDSLSSDAGSPATTGLLKQREDEKEGKKKQFEEGLLNDPSSDISTQYQDIMGRILNGKIKPETLKKMSASQIKQYLPQVEKMAEADQKSEDRRFELSQRAEDRKLTREIARQNRELAVGEKSDQWRERQITSYRDTLQRSDAYKDWLNIKGKTQILQEAVNNPSAFGDLGVVFDYMKALDPGSVVREGEQKAFKSIGSLPQKTVNAINGFLTGKSLTPEQREEILGWVRKREAIQRKLLDTQIGPMRKQAERNGFSMEEIDSTLSEKPVEEKKASSTSIMKDPRTGKKYEVDNATKKVIREVA